MKSLNICEIKHKLSQMLDPKRLAHTYAVCEAAIILAERFGADKNKAYQAALLHDCARGLNEEQLKTYCHENNIELDDYMKNEINPVHALVGADMAKRQFDISDEAVLSAIRNHAIGCEKMSLLDKIIYVADAIEPNRTGSDADKARAAAKKDLDKAIPHVMRIKSYHLQGRPMHPQSIKMLNTLK